MLDLSRGRGFCALAVLAIAPLCGAQLVSDEALLGGHRGDSSTWPMYGGDYAQQRYSDLDQINRDTVEELAPAWTYHSGIFSMASGFQCTPVVFGGAMYVTTSRVGRSQWLIRLDARTGEEVWKTEIPQGASRYCCGPNNRGASLYGDKVYMATIDGRLIALEAATGKKVWEVSTGLGEEGYSQTSAPLVFDGKIVLGVAGGEYGIRGYVTAYDADNGEQLWRWYTIPSPEDGGWEGDWVETAPGLGLSLNRDIEAEKADVDKYPDAWSRGGVPVWTTPSLDPELRLVYVTTGNPGPDYDASVRPGDNLWGDALCALDVDTGELVWGFQYVPHDVWDYDGGCPPVLFDLQIDGETVPAVALLTKVGVLYLLNRKTGELLKTSEPYVPHENLFTPLTEGTIVIAPGSAGGTNWSPAGYNPQTGWVYSVNMHWPMAMTSRPGQVYKVGAMYQGGNASFGTKNVERWGNVTAIDPLRGKVVWEARTELPMFSGLITTAGGLVFAGESNNLFGAWDAESGERLWTFETEAGANAAPMTYALDGRQYVVVAAGGSRYLRRDREAKPRADAVIAFALPE